MKRSFVCLSVLLAAVFLISGCTSTGSQVKQEPAQVYSGPKKRIAVMDFEDKVPRQGERIGLMQLLWGGGPAQSSSIGTGMSDMLTTALMQTGRFLVVERQNLEDVLKEQQLGASGMVNEQTSAKVGDLVGAQILIRGAVTEFQEKTGGSAGGFALPKFGIGVKTASAHVAIDIKIYDVTTGVVLDAKNISKEIKESGLAMAANVHGIKFGGAEFQKTPVGKAVRECINEAVEYVTIRMDKVAWQARIALVNGEKIYINIGEGGGIKVGDVFTVYRPGTEIVDPETGISLGFEESRVASIRVDKVTDKFSIASATEGAGIKKKDIVRLK